MPTISEIGLPPPPTYQEFETIVCDYFSHKYGVPFQKWGRPGQAQYGIDLLGRNIGVQCKNYINTPLTIQKLENDIHQAEQLDPPLDKMYIVTTAREDVNIQQYVRSRVGKFPVEIYYWSVIENFLLENPRIKEKHYPIVNSTNATELFINEFLKLCNKYNIYAILEKEDYIAPYSINIIENSINFINELNVTLNSDGYIGVDKKVLQDIAKFYSSYEKMISVAAIDGHCNANSICTPIIPNNQRESRKIYYLNTRKELLTTIVKYKYGISI